MVRKCANIAFGLLLIAALAVAMTHVHPLKAPAPSTGFSTPCEPALPALKAASQSPAVSTFDSIFAAAQAGVPAGAARTARVEAVSRPAPPPEPSDFPPLLHRPPPANS